MLNVALFSLNKKWISCIVDQNNIFFIHYVDLSEQNIY